MTKVIIRRIFHSIYAKLFLAFFIIIIPLQVTQYAMYQWGERAVTAEMNSAASANVIYLRDNFVGNIQSINRQLSYLLNENSITSFFVNHDYLSNWDYYSAVSQIKTLLALIKNSNSYIDEIRLYYSTFDLCLSSKQGVINFSDKELTQTLTNFRHQNALLMESEEQMIIGYMAPATAYFHDETPQYFVQAMMNNEKVEGHLSSFSQYNNQNAIMVNHNTGSVRYSANNEIQSLVPESSLLSFITPQDIETVYSTTFVLQNKSYIAIICYSSLINCSFVQIIPSAVLQTIPNRFRFFIWFFSGLSVIVIILFSYIMFRLVKKPINDLIDAFSVTGRGNFDKLLTHSYSTDEYNKLAENYNGMIRKIKELILTNYEQTIRLQHSELKQLQAQINPHFLYNSFFFLRHMIGQENDAQIRAFLTFLGRYFQYITKNDSELVSLKQELEHSNNYLAIQIMRFSDRIRTIIAELPEEYRHIMVPRLILQPIFENICEHGIKTNDHIGYIRVGFRETDPFYLHVMIEDNGNQLSDETLLLMQDRLLINTPIQETSGLINIHRRIQLHFGDECGLNLTRSELGGLMVDVKISIIEVDKT